MPLNVRRYYTSVLLVLFGFITFLNAQAPSQVAQAPAPQTAVPVKSQTSGDVMRDRISKAKAFIAVRNYNAAIYELEQIRKETSDVSVQSVTNVLLMNSYLEQGDYKRAQGFLTELYNLHKTNRPNSAAYYSTVAGQVIKGARNQVERYRALGLTVSDRNLPLEAVNDIERMRETIELVVTQAKESGKDPSKSAASMALLEEATNSRSMIARDEYDARRWRDELGDSREQLASSRSVIINAVDGKPVETAVPQNVVAMNTNTAATQTLPTNIPSAAPAFKPVADTQLQPSETTAGADKKPPIEAAKTPDVKPAESTERTRIVVSQPVNQPKENTIAKTEPPASGGEPAKDTGPMEIGSLLAYATKQTAPIYPPAARTMRATGVVKVDVTISETGDVASVKSASGHALLQGAARDAIMKWKFKPFVRDGQPVKANGFVNFNFSL